MIFSSSVYQQNYTISNKVFFFCSMKTPFPSQPPTLGWCFTFFLLLLLISYLYLLIWCLDFHSQQKLSEMFNVMNNWKEINFYPDLMKHLATLSLKCNFFFILLCLIIGKQFMEDCQNLLLLLIHYDNILKRHFCFHQQLSLCLYCKSRCSENSNHFPNFKLLV